MLPQGVLAFLEFPFLSIGVELETAAATVCGEDAAYCAGGGDEEGFHGEGEVADYVVAAVCDEHACETDA